MRDPRLDAQLLKHLQVRSYHVHLRVPLAVVAQQSPKIARVIMTQQVVGARLVEVLLRILVQLDGGPIRLARLVEVIHAAVDLGRDSHRRRGGEDDRCRDHRGQRQKDSHVLRSNPGSCTLRGSRCCRRPKQTNPPFQYGREEGRCASDEADEIKITLRRKPTAPTQFGNAQTITAASQCAETPCSPESTHVQVTAMHWRQKSIQSRKQVQV